MPALTKVSSVPTQVVIMSELSFDYSQLAPEHRPVAMAAASDIKTHVSRVNDSGLAVGKRLASIKNILPHGQFTQWVATEFQFTDRTAQNLMNLQQAFGHRAYVLRLFSQTGGYLLAAPSVTETIRVEAIKVAEGKGSPLTTNEVNEIIKLHKKAGRPRKNSKLSTPIVHERTEMISVLRNDAKTTTIDGEFSVVEPDTWNELYAKAMLVDWPTFDPSVLNIKGLQMLLDTLKHTKESIND